MISALFNLFLARLEVLPFVQPVWHPVRTLWLTSLTALILLSPGCASRLVGQNIQSPYPIFQGYAQPTPAPAAPGDAFAPTMAGAAAAGTPASAEWTRSAGPDESVLLTGNQLSAFTGDSRGKDSRFICYDGTPTYKEASVQRLDSGKAVITLPQASSNWGMYLVWPGNSAGFGRPIAINQTDAWWVGPDKATRGATVSVYGRNLAHHNDTLTSYVLIKPAAGEGRWATVKRVNPYKVDFVVPADLADGEYEVWTHNGHGQQYGWSGPLKLTLYGGLNWTTTSFNVKSYGATGNGITDDTPAINKALAAAQQSAYSTVYFPAGVYVISSQLSPAGNTRWQGDGRNRSALKCASNFSSHVEAMVWGGIENFEVRDMAFLGNESYHGTQGEPIFMRGSKNLAFTNVLFSFQNYNVLQLDNCYGVSISNCELIGKTSFLGKCTQLFINGCQFKVTNDAEMALDSWGGACISLTNSTCQDYDNSNPADGAGWGKGRFYAGRGNFGSSRLTYIGGNRTLDLAVRPVGTDQNSGEQFMWEGYTTDWRGPVTAATATTATLSGFAERYEAVHYAIITKGTGLGQARRVIAYNGSVITLDSPWNLAPDNTSSISLANVNDRAVLYQNTLDGKKYATLSPDHNASAGIEPYGATTNFIADSNTLTELRAGIANWATQNKAELAPNFFSLFTRNTLTNCRWGILNGLYVTSPKETGLFGTTYRQNQVVNALQSAVANLVSVPGKEIVLSYFMYEHNSLQSLLGGFSAGGDAGLPHGFPADGRGIENQFFYKNTFKSAGAAGGFGLRVTAAAVIRENSLSGFAQPYVAAAPKGQLEAPFHVIELAGTTKPSVVTASLTLWNSGVTPLNWVANSDATWLTLPVAKGVIQNEKLSAEVPLKVATSGLAPGTHTATIVVTVGEEVKKYSVVLTIAAAPAPVTTVGIISPAAGSQLAATAVAITARASTTAGAISKVEFLVNNKKVGEVTAQPFSYTWVNPPVGSFQLIARAITTVGDTTKSSPVGILISKPLATASAYQLQAAEVYPNPATNELTVASNLGSQHVSYKLFNNAAMLVQSGEFIQKAVLDISKLSAGLYLLKLLSKDERVARYFIKAD